MGMHEYGRGWGRGPRGPRWMLPLIVGLLLGAALVGVFSAGRSFGGGRGNRYTAQQYMPQQQYAPQAQPQQRVAPYDQRDRRGAAPYDQRGAAPYDQHDRMGRGFERGGRHGGFGFFGPLRLLGALMLLGVGAWLIFSGRRNPGNPGGTGGTPSGTAPARDVPVQTDPPATGETRML